MSQVIDYEEPSSPDSSVAVSPEPQAEPPEPVNPTEDWLDQEGDLDLPSRGEIREGVVVSAGRDNVLVDIGGKSEGLIDRREWERMSNEQRQALEMGAEVLVYVVTARDHEGNTILSLEKAKEEADWRWVETLFEEKESVEVKVTGYNKGGLLADMRRLRGFVPASQIDSSRHDVGRGATPADRWGSLVGEAMQVKVIEVNRNRNRLILSEREARKEWREAQRERLMAELQEGQIREGHVSNLTPFGAFVDLGGIDGLVHISELSWKHVTHPRQVVKVGDTVKVYVLNVDREQARIGLSLKRLEPDPWFTLEEECPIGTLLEGTITNLTDFGAFARPVTMEAIEGLIHISELSEQQIQHPSEVVEKGQRVTMRVISVDVPRRRLALSLKQVYSDEFADADWPEE